MAWLYAGVPVTLVIDLLDPAGPNSAGILAAERGRASPDSWVSGLIGYVSEQLTLPAADLPREPAGHSPSIWPDE